MQVPSYHRPSTTQYPTPVCDIHHGSQQSQARNQTCNLIVPGQIHFHCALHLECVLTQLEGWSESTLAQVHVSQLEKNPDDGMIKAMADGFPFEASGPLLRPATLFCLNHNLYVHARLVWRSPGVV